MNGLKQVLVYANDFNMLGGNISHTKIAQKFPHRPAKIKCFTAVKIRMRAKHM
jgi:hypothetical protein